MSWKGFTKAINRLPHQILSKKSEATKDGEYMQHEKVFNESLKQIELLAKDARIFRDSIAGLLSNQAAMAQYLSIIYDSALGTEVPEGMVQKRVQQPPATALQAVNDAAAAMAYCRDEVLPELDIVDRDIVRPLLDLTEIMKVIQKTMVKRNHKLIDYDRHRLALNKLNTKTERSFSEEKQIFKIQSQLETATQDYNYLNDMLKAQLPQFFQLKSAFIAPVFKSLYNMQCRIYGMIYARCFELLNQNLNGFTSNTMGIEEGFNWRKMQKDARAELENTDLLKGGGKAWLAASGGGNNSKLSLQERAAIRQAEAQGETYNPNMNNSTTNNNYGAYNNGVETNSYGNNSFNNNNFNNNNYSPPPPVYGSAGGLTMAATPIQSFEKQQVQASIPMAAPAPPSISNVNNRSNVTFVTAIYDYNAQAEGDLTFKRDDKIELIERTADTNDWWTGRLNGVTGVFPGNYVA